MITFAYYPTSPNLCFSGICAVPRRRVVEESGDLGHGTEHENDSDGGLRQRRSAAINGNLTRTGTYCADLRGRVLPDNSYITGSEIDVSG